MLLNARYTGTGSNQRYISRHRLVLTPYTGSTGIYLRYPTWCECGVLLVVTSNSLEGEFLKNLETWNRFHGVDFNCRINSKLASTPKAEFLKILETRIDSMESIPTTESSPSWHRFQRLEQGWTRVYPVPPWHWVGLDSASTRWKAGAMFKN